MTPLVHLPLIGEKKQVPLKLDQASYVRRSRHSGRDDSLYYNFLRTVFRKKFAVEPFTNVTCFVDEILDRCDGVAILEGHPFRAIPVLDLDPLSTTVGAADDIFEAVQ